MHLIVRQNTDLCEVSGYPFEDVVSAFDSAHRTLGAGQTECVKAVVERPTGSFLPCHVVRPTNPDSGLCREGQMHLIAEVEFAAEIAVSLTRRNQKHGTGKVVFVDA